MRIINPFYPLLQSFWLRKGFYERLQENAQFTPYGFPYEGESRAARTGNLKEVGIP